MNPLPGQEDRNLNFLVNNGAAIMVNDTYPISEAINQMFACPWRVAMMEESVDISVNRMQRLTFIISAVQRFWQNQRLFEILCDLGNLICLRPF